MTIKKNFILENYSSLINDVQHNCNISDAKHAGNYTLCVYLLKMREYYRWENKQRFNDELSQDNIGQWLSQREAMWEELENEDYKPLRINDTAYNPFDSEAINQILLNENLIYSGGYGVKSKPHFFVATLKQHQHYNGYNIYISGEEYARDLTSPPAMSQQQTIYIRHESFKRMIWERTEEWKWNKPQNAMAKAIACYDFDNKLEQSLDAMTENEINAAVLHEIGEIQAGEQLHGWQQMMNEISFTQAEIMARAVRDHFADTLHTLPTLLDNTANDKNRQASLHFYFANLTNMRKHLYPSLMQAYQQWCDNGDLQTLQENTHKGKKHWQQLATDILDLYRKDPQHCSQNIEELVNNRRL